MSKTWIQDISTNMLTNFGASICQAVQCRGFSTGRLLESSVSGVFFFSRYREDELTFPTNPTKGSFGIMRHLLISNEQYESSIRAQAPNSLDLYTRRARWKKGLAGKRRHSANFHGKAVSSIPQALIELVWKPYWPEVKVKIQAFMSDYKHPESRIIQSICTYPCLQGYARLTWRHLHICVDAPWCI